jgi:hypothetical protein
MTEYKIYWWLKLLDQPENLLNENIKSNLPNIVSIILINISVKELWIDAMYNFNFNMYLKNLSKIRIKKFLKNILIVDKFSRVFDS